MRFSVNGVIRCAGRLHLGVLRFLLNSCIFHYCVRRKQSHQRNNVVIEGLGQVIPSLSDTSGGDDGHAFHSTFAL